MNGLEAKRKNKNMQRESKKERVSTKKSQWKINNQKRDWRTKVTSSQIRHARYGKTNLSLESNNLALSYYRQ